VLRLYGLFIRISAIKNPKAKQWVSGRKNWREKLKQQIKTISSQKKVWIHCASYGEFEQGRPLIEAISKQHPDYKIVLSFFSPSGYEAFKDWNGADLITYLPLDTKANAQDFIELVKPDVVIFIKYEFWLHFLSQLKNKNIPTYLVSAVFKPHHPFFKWYGGIFRKSLSVFLKLFVQDKNSALLLQEINIKNVEVVGDTRFDRVLELKQTTYENEVIAEFKSSKKLIIAGSTWPKDEDMLLKAFLKIKEKGVKLIIVPHEVEPRYTINTIKKINELGIKYALYSQDLHDEADILILDAMGLLSKIYKYADAAYVGGGFNGGLHNILEPGVFEIPVAFYGEHYVKYNEAVDLLALNVLTKVDSAKQLKETIKKQLFDETYREMVKSKVQQYFNENGHVTQKVLHSIQFA